MKIGNLNLNKKIMGVGIVFGAVSCTTYASVNYQCTGGEYSDKVCTIWQGNTADSYSSNVINQATIDNILKKQKNAKSITIEFTPGDYQVYPINIKGVNNLIFKLDKGTKLTAIPYKGSKKGKDKNSNGWNGAGQLINFEKCNNLTLIGAEPNSNQLNDNRPKADTTMPSVIDGNGSDWWRADKNKHVDAPYLVSLSDINGLTIKDIEFFNPPSFHIKIKNTTNININQILIHADQGSPNTDGINMSSVQGVNISNSTIYNGDDSIAVNSDKNSPCKDIKISNIEADYGHGISFGSSINSNIENVSVENVIFNSTANGIRIKAHSGKKDQSDFANQEDYFNSSAKSSISVQNITYNHISMNNVDNPIIFDLNYEGAWSKIQLDNISFTDIKAVHSKESANLICGTANNCKNMNFDQVEIDKGGKCENILLSYDGKTDKYGSKQKSCLSN